MYTGKIAAAAAAVALAALIGQIAPAAAGPSDSNMVYVSRYIDRAAQALQQDQHDYNGHRAAAVADIDRARSDIASALAYDNSHERYNLSSAAMANVTAETAFENSQNGSDRNLTYVKAYLERALDMLRNDNHDYGGYRVKAIADIEAARDQIATALRQDTRGEQPGVASDSNVRYTRAYVERGIDMLQHDQADYGGHRAAAMTAMQNADADLLAALRADRADESVPAVQALALPAGWVRGQHASNENVAYARVYVEHAIDMLQRDQHDYNGYRAKAVQQLQIAHTELLAALKYR
jgi:hypothetical protein